MDIDISGLTQQVQRNDDISDAHHGGLYSLCGLLLRLRDLYKWEHGLRPWEEPEPADLLEWVDVRENLWEDLALEEFQPITLGEESFQPFDVEGINRRLRPLGLVYGAGYAIGMKPSFFLAELMESRSLGELQVDTVDRELARDLFITPAMRQGSQIFARRSAMLFFLWDQVLEMRPSAKDALLYALAQYGIDGEALRRSPKDLGPQLEQVVGPELETWIHHEVGEVRESSFDGHLWHEIVSTYSNSPVEIFARVIKDLLADTHAEGLLGHIIRNRFRSSLGFYVSFIRPFTRVVFPEIIEVFRQFRQDEDWSAIERTRRLGHSKMHRHATALIGIHEAGKERGTEWARNEITSTLIAPLGILSASQAKDAEDEV